MTALELILDEMLKTKETYSISILSGTLDFPEYKRLCGVVHGLELAERELKDRIQTEKERNGD